MLEPVRPTVLAGKAAPIDQRGRLSAIAKAPIPGPWRVTQTGLAGDEQADLKNHGGLEKAVHQYPFDHYRDWSGDIGPHPLLAAPGAFGENLSTTTWTERNVHIGDIVRFGSATLQVSQGRQPCWKLNARFDRRDMSMLTQTLGRTGWYYRVLEEGEAGEHDTLQLIERKQESWPLSRLTRLLYVDTRRYDELKEMAEIPELAAGWRKLAARRIESQVTEDWAPRLTGEI
jgi:MOSC domain-containing protein YiiM